jgi:hypothetical protein
MAHRTWAERRNPRSGEGNFFCTLYPKLLSMTYIVNPRNRKQEKVLETLLKSLSIGFYTEEKEDAAIINAIVKGRRTRLLTTDEKTAFLRKLKSRK